jgi:hypothetical protein
MPRNGLKAVETKEPDDLYDGLSQDAKDTWDAIGAVGYTPERGLKGMWFARKTGDTAKEAIGPADSLAALYSQVKAALPDEEFVTSDDEIIDAEFVEENIDYANPEMMELADDGEGNPYLPGQRPSVIKVLANAILDYDRVKLQRVDLSNQESTAKKKMAFLLKKFEPHLDMDVDKKEKFYRVGKVRGKIKIEEKEVFQSDHATVEND